jgi:hypothetical protein
MTSRDSTEDLINSVQKTIDHIADSHDKVPTDDADDPHNEVLTNNTDDFVNTAKRENDLANLLILERGLKNIITDSGNETSADGADDLHHDTSTDSTDGFINSIQRMKYILNLLKTSTVDTSYIDSIQSLLNGAPLKVMLMIHHQFPDVELISPFYAGDGAVCHLSPDQRVDAESTIQSDFSIDLTQEESVGILMHKLQRKNINQSNEVVISSEEEVTCIQFVIIWKVNSSKEVCVDAFLMEHDNNYAWDESRLIKLAKCCKLSNVRDGSIKSTWSIYDNTVLRIILNVSREKGYCKLEITISEGSINKNTLRPRYIDLDR